MKLGFLTACFPKVPLPDVAAWAASSGFEALEVASWPRGGDRDFVASHLDVAHLTEDGAADVHALFEEHGLTLSAVAYYDNNLHHDVDRRREIQAHVRRCVDAAALLGCPLVGTFVGRDTTLSVAENLALGEKELPPLVEYAGERGVRLVVENCPMEGWHPDLYPANLAYSPELWEWMFSLGLYLNYDPSHLVWLGIDPVTALRPHADKVLHVQAKDTEVDAVARNRFGVFGRTRDKRDAWDTGWWRYRVPGRGQVDWRGVLDVLDQGGFDGVVSVEHEDPVWSGTEDKIKQGLEIAHDTLRPLVRT
ncbi:sugar phosphate isomerase/epimerase family protein [Pseudonocardia sichuanensis]